MHRKAELLKLLTQKFFCKDCFVSGFPNPTQALLKQGLCSEELPRDFTQVFALQRMHLKIVYHPFKGSGNHPCLHRGAQLSSLFCPVKLHNHTNRCCVTFEPKHGQVWVAGQEKLYIHVISASEGFPLPTHRAHSCVAQTPAITHLAAFLIENKEFCKICPFKARYSLHLCSRGTEELESSLILSIFPKGSEEHTQLNPLGKINPHFQKPQMKATLIILKTKTSCMALNY